MTGAHPPHSALGTRVAVVSGNFSPEIGYQEVDLAAAFRRLGAGVLVVTSTRPSRNAQAVVHGAYPAGLTQTPGYAIVRLEPRLVVGTNVLGCKVLPVIEDFAPCHVVLVGPGKLFGLDLFASESAPWTRIAILQDNSDDGSSDGPGAKRLLRAAVHRVIKRRAYRRVVRNADRVVLNVPETRDIVSKWLNGRDCERLSAKVIELRLGFDPETFFFDLEGRRRWRDEHEIDDEEILLVTCTRATPEKRLERIVDAASRLRGRGLAVRYVLAGLTEDDYARRIRDRVTQLDDPGGYVLLPTLRHDEMRQLFSACDLGFWPRAAITIQQAMGTGLPVVLRNTLSVRHLVKRGRNGWYVESHETFEQVLQEAVASLHRHTAPERNDDRQATAAVNRDYLSYDKIALEMVR